MSTWHQERKGRALPKLSHPIRWSSYNPTGHLCVMRHFTEDTCMAYCDKTGDIPVPPDEYPRLNCKTMKEQNHVTNQNI